jgi:alpha-tubulin suppressor-like RCC1 family protein
MLNIRNSIFILFITFVAVITATSIEVTYDLDRGWNMVAVPCIVEDSLIIDILPIIPPALKFDPTSGSYHELLVIPPTNVGIWVLSEIDTTFSIECECEESPDPFWTEEKLVSGFYHTIALKNNGFLWTWGWNPHGQLGNGTTVAHNHPLKVLDSDSSGFLARIVDIAAGEHHSLALKNDGTVWAWGDNRFGQLGIGDLTEHWLPVQVKGEDGVGYLTDVVSISTSFHHCLALKEDGSVWAWGENSHGQLGDGTSENRLTPVRVLGVHDTTYLSNIGEVYGGGAHSNAITEDGYLLAWGNNYRGELGDSTLICRSRPVHVRDETGVGNLDDIVSVSGAGMFTIALKSDGTVVGTGYNGWGMLGDGTNTNRRMPVHTLDESGIENLDGIIALSGGVDHCIAIKNDFTLRSWGYNYFGHLGDGTRTNRFLPVGVLGEDGTGLLSEVIAISANQEQSVALKQDGSIWIWNVQFGPSMTIIHTIPVQLLNDDGTGFNLYE